MAHAPLSDDVFKLLWRCPDPECPWRLEETPEGLLCLTTETEVRRVITPLSYCLWEVATLRSALLGDGLPADLAERLVRQAGF